MVPSFLALILFAVGSLRPGVSFAAESEEDNLDIRSLKDAGVGTDSTELLRLLGRAATIGADVERIDALIRQLGDEDFDKRENAFDRLISVGSAALSQLHIALKDPTPEIARRAKVCIERIEKKRDELSFAPAAARLLILRHPAGTAEALLGYLPYAVDPAVAEEIVFGLDALAVRDAKARSALATFLKDSLPARRAAAACILGRLGDKDQRAAAGKLLKDTDPLVRLRAAQGSLAAGDKAALPILIALLEQPEADIAWQAEELLHWAAGDDSPDEVVGTGAAAELKACQAAWRTWWRDHGPMLDLQEREKDPRRPGLVLVCGATENGKQERGAAVLLGCDGTTRWKLDTSDSLADAVFIPGNRLLMLVQHERTVTERDRAGKKVESPISSPTVKDTPQPRFLGPALIYERHVEVQDGTGNARGSYKVVLHVLQIADQTVDGRLVSLDSSGSVREVDPEARPFAIFPRQDLFGRYGLEALRDGHFLVTDTSRNRVRELNSAGNVVWEKRFKSPLRAIRLPNGGMLLTSQVDGGAWMSEVNSDRESVWRVPVALRPARARICFGAVRLGFDRPRDTIFDTTMAASRLRAVKSKDVSVRRRAAVDMGFLGQNSPEAITALIEAIKDRDPNVRRGALLSLQLLGPRAKASVPALIEKLAGPNDPDCEHLTQYALRDTGPSAIPELVQALKHGTGNSRVEAAWVLAWLGKEDSSCVPALIDALKDDDSKVRSQAIWSLGKISPFCKDAIPALAQAIDDKDAGVRLDATVELYSLALCKNGRVDLTPALPPLLKAVKDKDWQVRGFALRALGVASLKNPKIAPALLEGLNDADYRVVCGAADGLAQIGPDANVPVAKLLGILKTKNLVEENRGGSTHENALAAFEQIGPRAAKEAVPILIQMLGKEKDEKFQVHSAIAATLGRMGPAAKDAIPILVEEARANTIRELPHSEQTGYCNALIQALVGIGEEGLAALLSGGLTDWGDVRLAEAMQFSAGSPSEADGAVFSFLLKKGGNKSACAAAERLGSLGPKGKDAAPVLREALASEKPAIRVSAARALAHIGTSNEKATAILIEDLKRSDASTWDQMRTVWALGNIRSYAKEIVPALLECLDPLADMRAARRRYLPGLPDYTLEMEIDYRLDGYENRSIGLDRFRGDVEACAIVTLGRLGPNAKAAIPALIRRLQDPDADLSHRCLAAEALGRMGPAGKVAVPNLVRVLKDDDNDPVVQAYAAEALGNIGGDAKDALPLLKEASTQRATLVRRSAAKALRSIHP
jgi:HEAT repeat protein